MEIKALTFFGCSCGEVGEENFENTKNAAKALAESGRTIANGGGPGIMLAATLGAKEGQYKGPECSLLL
ncbi:hypothetical protein HY407_03005 [Candidatus Gottesmanbacteria bacterium]|nr:hypothetical protein [Candidatus Gottesmanbacteria bacterium]